MRHVVAVVCVAVVGVGAIGAAGDPFVVDRDGARWVEETRRKLTVDEKIGQLIVPSFESGFLSTDSDTFDDLARLVREYHVGGFHVFGASQPAPPVLLDASYGTVLLGQPLSAAFLLNRLQAMSAVPLLNTADFETGAGFRLAGATSFPRQMAMGAANDERLVREQARITGLEARAIGVHVTFAPVADVNNNPRNPVINVRSYGEDPARVAALVAAYVDGARDAGMIATLKHFPGHGDTDVDSHLGLPVITFDRARLDRVELAPFKRGIERGAQAVMAAHIELPALDDHPSTPATFSKPILDDLLRRDVGFRGLIYTDSMSMDAVTRLVTPAEGAVRAVLAGADQVLHSPDPIGAFKGLKQAVAEGRVTRERLDESLTRVLRAKASLGLHLRRAVDLDAVPDKIGGRAHQLAAQEASAKSVTLIKDVRHHVPLAIARDASVLYLSVLDYPSGWQIAAPSRTFIPELKKRWPQVTSIEISDRTSLSDLDVVRAVAPRYAAIVASVFVRATSGSGRLDLSPDVVRLLRDLARAHDAGDRPFVTTVFGNPYVAAAVPELPAVLLTYDFYDMAELSAVRALSGETAISGRLPVSLPGLLPAGQGLDRPGK
ncbi:MAG TPA: glycoside hydrolase family 3 protein [Vicinamibacterales bacterium]|jgi:beta-N-acetylhexosaminidase|nr:glycoside hydrolase family 3 protein [Vicinamibacterales bacterium]